jgi:hypothetical protein
MLTRRIQILLYERQAAARRVLAAPPMTVPTSEELRRELDELRARRA